jgi:iron complex outermembrane receptor protein
MQKFWILLCLLCLSTSAIWAQNVRLTGKVTDASGAPMVGVTIYEKGKMRGTISDGTGNYALVVSPNARMVFSFVGFIPQEIRITSNRLDVSLVESENNIGLEVVGSRNANRSATRTVVPVDVLPISELVSNSGQVEISQLLQYIAPSFNASRQTGTDGSDHIDPASLRGLGPDQTLVLINGKRRHQSSLINIFGTRGRGNTGTDFNAIPAAAIERIEILRDGAAAQYGSDAIAGVINIVLKDQTGIQADLSTGQYTAGDGRTISGNINWGKALSKGGFVNVTVDGLSRARTLRANDETLFPGSSARNFVGDAEAQSAGFLVNMVVPTDKAQFYLFGGYNYRFSDNYQWNRDADNLQRNIPSIYPNGFTPQLQAVIEDPSLTVGIKGKKKEWNWDLSNSFGQNRFEYRSHNTLNASFQPRASSPTDFKDGGFKLGQDVVNFDLSRYFKKNDTSGINLAFGAEFRQERYQIFAGEEASYKNYGALVSVKDASGTTIQVPAARGAQGFPGFQPSDEVNETRNNLGIYTDIEYNVSKAFTLAGAGRFEHYSDFGNTLNGKLAFRYAISPTFALRGSVSTGFRAPSLPQIHFNSIITTFIQGIPYDAIIARNSGTLAQAVGIPALKQETAQNATLGFTLTPADGFSITVDGYSVNLQDRVLLTGIFPDTDNAIGSILKASNLSNAQFFTNALDTKTKGVDVVMGYTTFLGNGRLRSSFAANFNKLELGDIQTAGKLAGKEDVYFDIREQSFLKASAPPSKMNLTFEYKVNKLNLMTRFVRWDKVSLINFSYDEANPDAYSAKVTTDLTVNYDLGQNIQLGLNAMNLFNVHPDKHDPVNTESGAMWDAVQMGFNGAFIGLKLNVRFK